jgi:hypothetical protein
MESFQDTFRTVPLPMFHNSKSAISRQPLLAFREDRDYEGSCKGISKAVRCFQLLRFLGLSHNGQVLQGVGRIRRVGML